MDNIKIKLSIISNLPELLPLVHAYHEFEGIRLSEDECVSAVETLLTDNVRGGIWLIYLNENLVGYIVLCVGFGIEFAGLDAFIDEFYISPAFRGTGIGTKVLQLIKTEAKKLNIRAIHLEVSLTNIKAQKLYTNAKFIARDQYMLMSCKI